MRLLYVVHGLPPAETTGTPLQAHAYAVGMAQRRHSVTVVAADERQGAPDKARTARGADGKYDIVSFPGTPARWAAWAMTDWRVARGAPGARDREFERVLIRTRPDVVHVIDLVHLPSEWPRVAHARGIPVVRSFCNAEDLCGLIEPIHGPGGRCPLPLGPAGCAEHIARNQTVQVPAGSTTLGALETMVQTRLALEAAKVLDDLQAKREELERDLDSTYDALVFATAAWRDVFAQSVDLPMQRSHVVPLGTRPLPTATRTVTPDAPLRLGFLAQPTFNKGMDTLIEAMLDPRIVERSDLTLDLWCPAAAGSEYDPHRLTTHPGVTLHPPFTPAQLGEVVTSIDVCLSLSRFESFHRVTREALLAGCAVIGTDAPGIGEVVRDGVNGLTIQAGDAESLIQAILRFADDRALLASCQAGATATRIATPDEELDQLEAIYDQLLAKEVPA